MTTGTCSLRPSAAAILRSKLQAPGRTYRLAGMRFGAVTSRCAVTCNVAVVAQVAESKCITLQAQMVKIWFLPSTLSSQEVPKVSLRARTMPNCTYPSVQHTPALFAQVLAKLWRPTSSAVVTTWSSAPDQVLCKITPPVYPYK